MKLRVVLFMAVGTDSLLQKTDQVVQQSTSQEGFNDFRSRWVLVVTWHNVSRYLNAYYPVQTLFTDYVN